MTIGRIAACLLILAVPGVLGAQQAGTLVVVVRDDGRPVAGARIFSGDLTATTRSDGTASLVVAPGRVDVVVTKDGYDPAATPVEIRAGVETRIEVEVTAPQYIDEAIDAGADTILLDNFTVEQTREAVLRCEGRVPLESSGGITLDTVRDYAEAGVDIISVGALTHSPSAADIHLRVTPE